MTLPITAPLSSSSASQYTGPPGGRGQQPASIGSMPRAWYSC
jgi:hypothetical protein